MYKLCDVCFFSGNVRNLAAFYKKIFEIDNDSSDNKYQELSNGNVRMIFYDDGTVKPNNNQNISLFFDVGDVDSEYERLRNLDGIKLHIIKKPEDIPNGRRCMSFYDLDGNVINFISNGDKS